MQMVLMSHRTTAPQIEALEPEYWGVSWGVGVSENLYPIDIKVLLSQILEARVGIEPALTDLQSAA